MLFWTGVGIDVYYGLAPVALFFLTLERCLALIFAYKYDVKAKRSMLSVELAVIIVCFGICAFMCVAELPLDEEKGSLKRKKDVITRLNFSRIVYANCMFDDQVPCVPDTAHGDAVRITKSDRKHSVLGPAQALAGCD